MQDFKQRIKIPKLIASVSILFFVFLSFSYSASGQTGVIRGSVFDSKTKEPLPGASITITGISAGLITDENGNYSMNHVPAGIYQITGSYLSYKPITRDGIVIRNGDTAKVEIALNPEIINLSEIEIVAKVDRETENTLLREQRKSLAATQMVSARELSRKGFGDAEMAVSRVSGVSKQEGVKNVFVRGLGDRYNATLLNGMQVPSDDPEYKNIALTYFSADIIQHITVNKVFSAENSSDAGGAVINIASKESFNNHPARLEISAGLNTYTNGKAFLRPAGSDYFGFARATRPVSGKFDFSNKLDPSVTKLPVNQGF